MTGVPGGDPSPQFADLPHRDMKRTPVILGLSKGDRLAATWK
jgi:hypothetical protein